MHIFLRILAALLMICLIAFAPWWLILAGALIFLFIYDTYYEIILWGIACDALYGLPHGVMGYFATVTAVALLFFTIFLKKRLAVYS